MPNRVSFGRSTLRLRAPGPLSTSREGPGSLRWRVSFLFARRYGARCSGGLNHSGRGFATVPCLAPRSCVRLWFRWAPDPSRCCRLWFRWEGRPKRVGEHCCAVVDSRFQPLVGPKPPRIWSKPPCVWSNMPEVLSTTPRCLPSLPEFGRKRPDLGRNRSERLKLG